MTLVVVNGMEWLFVFNVFCDFVSVVVCWFGIPLVLVDQMLSVNEHVRYTSTILIQYRNT